jgi:uncharacterized protein YneF (UPF0154 family)
MTIPILIQVIPILVFYIRGVFFPDKNMFDEDRKKNKNKRC